MKKKNVGGQAVIEGVLMKYKNKISVAVRKSNRKITVKTEKYNSISKKYQFLNWPVFRGSVMLLEMMVQGMKALTYSANESISEEEEKLSTKEIAITLVISLGMAVGLFFILPLFLTSLIKGLNGVLFHFVDGLIRVAITLSYIILIGFMRDVRRIFEYHGAEHKAVNCYEAGEELTVKNAKKFTTLNPRCGTSFIFFVLIISILIFSLIPANTFISRILSRIIFLPIIAGLSYEFLKYSAKNKKNKFIKILIAPGLWMQKLTTKEPNEKQLEVAIVALKEVTGE